MLLFILLLGAWTSDTQSRCSVYFGATWQNAFVFLFLCLPPKCRHSSRFCLLSLFLGFCIFMSVISSTHFKLCLEGIFISNWLQHIFIWMSFLQLKPPAVAGPRASSPHPAYAYFLFSLNISHSVCFTKISRCIISNTHKIQPPVCLWHWYLYIHLLLTKLYLRHPVLPLKSLLKPFKWFSHFQSLSTVIHLKYHCNTNFPQDYVTDYDSVLV